MEVAALPMAHCNMPSKEEKPPANPSISSSRADGSSLDSTIARSSLSSLPVAQKRPSRDDDLFALASAAAAAAAASSEKRKGSSSRPLPITGITTRNEGRTESGSGWSRSRENSNAKREEETGSEASSGKVGSRRAKLRPAWFILPSPFLLYKCQL